MIREDWLKVLDRQGITLLVAPEDYQLSGLNDRSLWDQPGENNTVQTKRQFLNLVCHSATFLLRLYLVDLSI